MRDKILIAGNDAIAEAGIRAGCRSYFGYPITPQNELLEYMSAHMPKAGGVFVQAESEIGAINMCYGASAAGARTMTSSSGPGMSLKLEGISYLAGSDLPCVIVNVARGGPGLGNIAPGQGDYFQATKGGGHGDYRMIVLAPATIPEATELTMLAFDLADKYRTPVLVLVDGVLGQMMEPVEFRDPVDPATLPPKPWALTGAQGRPPNIVTSFFLDPQELSELNLKRQDRYRRIVTQEVRYEEFETGDATIVIAAYGTVARIARTTVKLARNEGIKLGLLRPITLWPFPYAPLRALSNRVKVILTVEMSAGQMLEDVRLAVAERAETPFYGEMGGIVPTPRGILMEVKKYASYDAEDDQGF
ncbi:MAG: 3-methyl-2-oxobutanoate dehydrogenase subunit VorB [Dehalococcoidia bacterium]|nr:2-oxoglutarate oxidoreductase subunit KorA [Chloroflexota bacterium]MBT9160389.1 2-oxoglutarate oxidoreductase subunit KorA [Chloroflexota bacterium]MBT9161771.1 2-oxoglutarate oxidoreductase subunit KorA [Chloroflexota bacterium]